MTVNPISSVFDAYKPSKIVAAERTAKAAVKTDAYTVSPAAKDFQSALKAVSATPDIREAKVDSIKARMATSSYNISPAAIADKLVASYSKSYVF